MAVVEESEYKGNPMIVLRRTAEDRYPFQFGLSKAKLILDAFDEIKKWVEKQEKVKAASAPAAGAEE
jgi:hypothetical protein